MDRALYVVGCRMHCLAEDLQTVAANVANASTPGYKRTVNCFHAVLRGVKSVGVRQSGTCAAEWTRLGSPQLDMAQGPVSRTGRSLDVAIQGDAFLVVSTPRGQRYTRKGRLYLNASGDLTDALGNPFAARGGGLNIPPGARNVSIQRDGRLLADGRPLGALMLVDIPEPDKLVAEGAGLYRYEGARPERSLTSQVIQGAIEESNVQPVKELVGLVELMRAFESGSRVMRRLDALNNKLIQTAS
ncbi:MAG: flagellar hook basal-body protein [Candidatus Brocadiia bacterium]